MASSRAGGRATHGRLEHGRWRPAAGWRLTCLVRGATGVQAGDSGVSDLARRGQLVTAGGSSSRCSWWFDGTSRQAVLRAQSLP